MKRAIFLLAIVISGCATQPLTHGIPNLALVSPGIYRGGQPSDEGWRYLRSLGVTNVIKLNTDAEATDEPARQLGMTVIDFPINLRQQLGLEPLDLNYAWVFDELRADVNRNVNQGLFIHCEHGQDRTGWFVAQYRMFMQGWSKASAEKEMLAHGFHKVLRGLWSYWESLKPTAGQ
jgi:protein tyrosine/serine phosphatase